MLALFGWSTMGKGDWVVGPPGPFRMSQFGACEACGFNVPA